MVPSVRSTAARPAAPDVVRPIHVHEQDDTTCAACGAPTACWTLLVASDQLRATHDHMARFRLCDDHYRRLMRHMMATPDADPMRPLRGYT